MSSASLHKEVCPKCGTEQTIERYDSVNDFDKNLFSKIADKSIFDYECEACKEKIHAPYPLIFHKMGFRDIQIGYKITPIPVLSEMLNPFIFATKKAMKMSGQECEDISERYDDENEFANRVNEFIDLSPKIMYRPHKGTYQESMNEMKWFRSEDEMFEYIVKSNKSIVNTSSLFIGDEIIYDERNSWNTRYVMCSNYEGKNLDNPICIGMCTINP